MTSAAAAAAGEKNSAAKSSMGAGVAGGSAGVPRDSIPSERSSAPVSARSAGLPLILVRRLLPTDSLEELTMLLHRAYAGQVAMGLRPLAGRQDALTTARRCASGECYVALLAPHDAAGGAAVPRDSVPSERSGAPVSGRSAEPAKIVGTILFHEVEDAKGPPWFARSDVDSFSQFAVDPDVQRNGAGRLLLETVERRAAECGAHELGLSMAEADTMLMQYYLRRGYRFIENWAWPYTNYRSVILSKKLRE